MNDKYALKYRSDKIFDIFAPGQKENKSPVVTLKCTRSVAEKAIKSLSKGRGLPIEAIDLIIPTKN